jgi:hypothetical protein
MSAGTDLALRNGASAPAAAEPPATYAPTSAPTQWIFTPSNAREAFETAEWLAKSNLVPEAFRGKPGDILIALQMGADVGLAPMQALQGIAVINGRPALWGDAVMALVRSHPSVVGVEESLTGEGDRRVATCTLIRIVHGREERTTRTFSVEDAQIAGLWTKQGPWKQYPQRMLQMRARGFALRDGAADVLRGVAIVEDIMDVQPISVGASTLETTKRESIANTLATRAAELPTTQTPPAEELDEAERLKKMNPAELSTFVKKEAAERGIDPAQLEELVNDAGGWARSKIPKILEKVRAFGSEAAGA